jgi:hypothetical protein
LYINLFDLLNLVTEDAYAKNRGVLKNQDIYNVLICNKYLNKCVMNKMLKCTYFSLDAIICSQSLEKRKLYEDNICNLSMDICMWQKIPKIPNIQLYKFKKLTSIIIRYNIDLEDIKFINQNDESLQNDLTDKSKINKITFGFYYDKPINNNLLPLSLTSLQFGYGYNQPIEPNTLPDNLTELTFGDCFGSTSLFTGLPSLQKNSLPPNLKKITFGEWFNPPESVASLENIFPSSLTDLTFGIEFNQPIKMGVLPMNLENLSFGRDFNKLIDANVLPENLKSLTFGKCFNQLIEKGVLPINLTNLVFGNDFNQPIGINNLPINLINLTLGFKFDQRIYKRILPTNLKQLTIHSTYEPMLPINLLNRIVDEKSKKSIEKPSGLKIVIVCESFNNKEPDPFSMGRVYCIREGSRSLSYC